MYKSATHPVYSIQLNENTFSGGIFTRDIENKAI